MLSSQQNQLIGALIGLARSTFGNEYLLTDSTAAVVVEGMRAAMPGGNDSCDSLNNLIDRADEEKRKLVPMCYECADPCGRTNNYDMDSLWNADEEIRTVKSQILLAIQDIAGSLILPCPRDTADFLYKALFAIGADDWGVEELLPILQDAKQKYAANP